MARMCLNRALQLGAVFLLALAACGPGRGDLEGKVSFEGKPLAWGDVQVFGSDGEVRQGRIGPDGSYVIKDIAVGGPLKFAVYYPDVESSRPKSRDKGPGGVKPPEDKRDAKAWVPIPEDYSNTEKSGLVFEVKPGKNTWDINLKSKPE